MTLFARALKWGVRGAMAPGAAWAWFPMRAWKASPPRPTPHCWRNQRRDAPGEAAGRPVQPVEGFIIVSFLRDGFIQVEKHARRRHPGGGLRGGRSLRPDELLDPIGSGREVRLLAGEEFEEDFALVRGRRPADAEAEGDAEPFLVAGGLREHPGGQGLGAFDEQRLVERGQRLKRRV